MPAAVDVGGEVGARREPEDVGRHDVHGHGVEELVDVYDAGGRGGDDGILRRVDAAQARQEAVVEDCGGLGGEDGGGIDVRFAVDVRDHAFAV